MQKLFLFDFDGVIVDSLEVYEGTVTRCLEKIGQPIVKNRADYLALYEDNFYESLVKRGVDLDAFMKAAVDILAEIDYDKIIPFPEVLPVLDRLRENNILVVVSSSDSEDIKTTMVQYHFESYFREILGSDANLNKVEKIRHAMKQFGMTADRTYYVGDTAGDIKEGKMAGVKTVAVTWGWHTKEQLAARNPDFLIDNPEDLLKI